MEVRLIRRFSCRVVNVASIQNSTGIFMRRLEHILKALCSYPHAFLKKKRRGYCNRLRPSVRPSVRYAISS